MLATARSVGRRREVPRHERHACGGDDSPSEIVEPWAERAVAVAQQHRDGIDEWLGDGQVEVAVAVEVPATMASGNVRIRRTADHSVIVWRLEGAVAVAQQDR